MKKFTKILFLVLISISGVVLFQAQDVVRLPDDNDPNIDRIPYETRLFYSLHSQPPRELSVITNSAGYDNFDVGVDFAEVHLSVNPNNTFGFFGAWNTNGGHWTGDGNTFTNVTPPFPNTAGDPWTAYDSLGNLYYITLNSSVTGTWVLKSTNNGQSWGTAVSGCTGNDRETMAVDQTGGPFGNYIYCGETPGNFSRSTNFGASFTQTASMSNTLPGFMIAVGAGPTGISGGAVYVVTSTGAFQAPTYTIYRSTDGGATFTNMSVQSGWVNTVGTIVGGRNSYQNMRLRPYPFIYADNSFGAFRGRLYIFYSANNPGGDGNKPSIYQRYSTDGGATFSAPIIINDDASPTTNAHFLPAAVCEKTTGTLFVQWMDTRNTPTADSAEIFASMSTNGGITWATNQNLSTKKFRINCPSCGGGGTPAYQGDYSSIGANGNVSVVGWTDFRNNNFGSYFGYFPDYAMTVIPNSFGMNGTDSNFAYVSVPSVKLYQNKVKYTATVTPTPGTGTMTVSFLNRVNGSLQDTLTSYPDSLRVRVKTTGGVPNGIYTVTITGTGRVGGTDRTPVHKRTLTVNVGFVGVDPTATEIPEKFFLYQNYPNPFNPSTSIKFDMAKNGPVKIRIFDINGREVKTLIDGNLNAGSYKFDFNAETFASGIYFYKVETSDYVSIKKMALVK